MLYGNECYIVKFSDIVKNKKKKDYFFPLLNLFKTLSFVESF
jgi:hypothetical protein